MLSALVAIAALSQARAEPALPFHAPAARWEDEHQVDVTLFAKGLRYLYTLERRAPLGWAGDDILFRDFYVAPGVVVDVTPAFARAGARLHFVPIAVLDVQADAQFTSYFGAFSALVDFDSPRADHSEAAFDSGIYDGRRQAAFGLKLGLTPTPQLQVGKFILAMPQEFAHFRMQRPADARGAYWYEPFYDTMVQWNDTLVVNSALGFWAFRESSPTDPRLFWLGLHFNHQYVFGTGERTVKLGPMAVFKAGRSPWVPSTAL